MMDCHTKWYAIFASLVIVVHIVGGVRELPAKCHPDEKQALLQFKDALALDGTLETWKEGEDEDCCKWIGISCNNITGYVVQLHLTDVLLSSRSKISPALLKIKHLQHLHLTQYDPTDQASIPMRIPGFLGSFSKMRYLNLSHSFTGEIPQTLGNLSKLEVLDLSYHSISFDVHTNAKSLGWLFGLRALNLLNLNGVDLKSVGHEWMNALSSIPSLKELYLKSCQLDAVRTWTPAYFNFSSSLAVIDLSFNMEIGQSLQKWLLHSNISSLVRLDASYTRMNGSIAAIFINLQNLEELYLSDNLFPELPASIVNTNASLRILDLSNNHITGGALPHSFCHLKKLVTLTLGYNALNGTIPECLGLLSSLETLSLQYNQLVGNIPSTLGLLSSLETLLLNNNRLGGNLPSTLGLLSSLEALSLEGNRLEGNLPSTLGLLSSLETLSLSFNRLEGNLPSTFGQLSNLRSFRLRGNTLGGQVLETHFQHLSQLKELDFSLNFLKIQLPSNWVPPFRGLQSLHLDSCVVGPDFPPWIRMLKSLASVGLSNTSIQGSLPHWFSEISCLFHYLDLSNNRIQGNLPNMYNCSVKSDRFMGWDLSHNYMHGPISSLNATFYFLTLSFNQFGGSIPSGLISTVWDSIDLSYNQLIGEIPSSIGNCTSLDTLDLTGNHLYGQLPVSMGNLRKLQSLHLAHNNLSGMLPQELCNVTSLVTLDLGRNKFIGRIPRWIGESFPDLRFLRLRSNFFSMEIPQELMDLSSLCVLDLADNYLSGTIPHRIGNLTEMRTKQSDVRNKIIAETINYYSDSWEATYFRGCYWLRKRIQKIGNDPNSRDFLLYS